MTPLTWTTEREAKLRELWLAGGTDTTIGTEFGISPMAVKWRRWKLNLTADMPGRAPIVTAQRTRREILEYVRGRLAEKASRGVIADELGVTRNTICGLVYRHGLEGPSLGKTGERRKPVERKPKDTGGGELMTPRERADSDHGTVQRILIALNRAPVVTQPMIDGTDIPRRRRIKNILKLTNKTCRWPVGDPSSPDFFYCGARKANVDAGCPYCPGHARIAYRPAPSPVFIPKSAA